MFNKYKILHALPLVGQTIIYDKPSSWAWFTNVIEDEKALLKLGKTYTVAETELNSSSTYVWLQEFPAPTDDVRQPFFNAEAFSWELPELNLEDLIGFFTFDMGHVNRKYGYGFKDTKGNIMHEGSPFVVIDFDSEPGRISMASFEEI